jgi:hypothetical protein
VFGGHSPGLSARERGTVESKVFPSDKQYSYMGAHWLVSVLWAISSKRVAHGQRAMRRGRANGMHALAADLI